MVPFQAVLRKYWKAFVTLLLLPIAGNIFASEFRDWVYTWFGWKEPASYLKWTSLVSGLAFFMLAGFTIFFGRELFRPRNVALGPNLTPAPHPHVVLFLSALSLKHGQYTDGVPDSLPLTRDLDADFRTMTTLKDREPKAGGVRWLWEMPLRGIHHHREKLTSVTLVCSPESLTQAGWFAALLTGRYATAFPRLRPNAIRLLVRAGTGVELVPCPPTGIGDPATAGWDLEEYNELYEGLAAMLGRLAAEGTRDRDVIVDVTGGQKPNSVVGALLTVNRQAKFQYVQTGKGNAVIAYDLVTDPVG